MTKSSLSRQQRRKMERDLQKQNRTVTPVAPSKQTQLNSEFATKEELKLLVQDMQKVLNYAKLVDNHVWMIVETLDRKGILNWADVNETEALYAKKESKKLDKVKKLLEQDLSIPEYLEAIKDDPKAPGYEKLNIDPIKDLNINPFELGVFLREANPELSTEEFLEMGKPWNMRPDHFGFKAQSPAQQ